MAASSGSPASSAFATATNWTNVNNWHWIEKDCTSWSHERLRSILRAVRVNTAEGACISVTKLTGVEGDVSVSQRKGRVRQIFDLKITFDWKAAFGEKEGSGSVEINDFMSDTEFKGFEFNSSYDVNAMGIPAIKDAIERTLKMIVWNALEAFGLELMEVHGKPLLVQGNSEAEQRPADIPKNVALSGPQSPQLAANETGTETVQDKVSFNARPADVFAALTDPNMIRVWSRSSNPVQMKLGARFALFDGNVAGQVIDYQQDSRLKMEWRLKGWTAGQFSVVDLTFRDDAGRCIVELEQTGVPSSEAEATLANWSTFYWNPIKTTFGYGAIL